MEWDLRKRKNQRKLQVLGVGLDGREIDSGDLVALLGMNLTNASTCLHDYHRWGLFTRERRGKTYYYMITSKGVERYWWLLGQNRIRINR